MTSPILSWSIVLQLAIVGFALLLGLLALISIFSKSAPLQVNQADDTPPGSLGWPLVGKTLEYLKPHKSNSTGQFLQEHCSRYGRVFKSHLFGNPTIVSCDLELNTFILQNEGKLFASSYPKSVQSILGKLSMLLVSGEQHRKIRSTAVSHIGTSKSRPDFLRYIDKLSSSLMESWKERKRVPFFKEAKEFTLHVMLKNLLDMEPGDPIAPRILQDFLTFMEGFVSLPLYIPGSPYAKAVKARTRISSTLRVIINERKTRKEGYSRGDFLDEILQKGHLDDEEEVSIVLDLLLAGYETTSGLIALVVYFLAQAPKALQQLKDEHRKLRGNKADGELLDFEDYKQMEFTMNVINEALRCGNLVKFVHRRALKDVKFREYVIPAGWKVLPVISAPHLDPVLHQHPSVFNPWRWEDEATSKKFAPFGGGLRLCPGSDLAKLETAFFLHHFVLTYSWKIKEDECPVSHPYLEFKRGLLLEIEPL
ncbi:cytochrome P450 724B1 [Coffea eugenioides]|uniref:cytochrome P450 724B1 n=1 Tax=Coffea eugenioides TaxID=49369 RepID=UPI000F60D029|nr:cytochrome P450 724B1 [Coffea eugenioides]